MFNQKHQIKVDYYHVNSDTIIGYKPMFPILESKAEYLWVSGDSRYHDFNELDEKIFPYIKEGNVEYIVYNIGNNYCLPDTIYKDKGQMLHDTFVPSTCIGLSIYKTSIFDILKKNTDLMQKCDQLFKNNFGFGWLGYFYYAYNQENFTTLLANIKILPILDKKKTQSWAVRFYGCWVDDLCQIIDNIPSSYTNKEQIPKNTWKVMALDSFNYGYLARKYGDLNKEKYKDMITHGLINRITDNPKKIKKFATVPLCILEVVYLLFRVIRKIQRIIKK